jgi:hypothetical protein
MVAKFGGRWHNIYICQWRSPKIFQSDPNINYIRARILHQSKASEYMEVGIQRRSNFKTHVGHLDKVIWRRYHDVIMAVGGVDERIFVFVSSERRNYFRHENRNSRRSFWKRKKKFREITMKYGRLVVFIRHGSAEIWGFRYWLATWICTLNVMASNGVFVLVVCALIEFISGHGKQPSMILT